MPIYEDSAFYFNMYFVEGLVMFGVIIFLSENVSIFAC